MELPKKLRITKKINQSNKQTNKQSTYKSLKVPLQAKNNIKKEQNEKKKKSYKRFETVVNTGKLTLVKFALLLMELQEQKTY